MNHDPKLDFGQGVVIVSIGACLVASWARLSGHELWPEVMISISGAVMGIFGLLLAVNWRGLTERYSSPRRLLRPKKPLQTRQILVMRISGALLTLPALAAIASSITWLFPLLSGRE